MDRANKLILIIAFVAVVFGIAVMGVVTVKSFRTENGNKQREDAGIEEEIPGSANQIPLVRTDEISQEEKDEIITVYKGMKDSNPDFAGYLSVPGSVIGYPVMYTPYEPEKYLHMDINGVETDDGLPFIDARCNLEPDSDNIVIYGHNMKDGSMFASLFDYQDKAYFEEHPVIRFDTVDGLREYEVMSAFYDRVYYEDEDVFKFYNFIDAVDEEEYADAIKQYLKKSIYDTGATAEYGDKLVTLVTCAYHTENGRFVVVARRRK